MFNTSSTSYRQSRLLKARLYAGLLFIVLALSSVALAYQLVARQIALQAQGEATNVLDQLDNLFAQLDKATQHLVPSLSDSCQSLKPQLMEEILKVPGGLTATKPLRLGFCNSLRGYMDQSPVAVSGPSISLDTGIIEPVSVYYRDKSLVYELSMNYFLYQLKINPDFIKPTLILADKELTTGYPASRLIKGELFPSSKYDYTMRVQFDQKMYFWELAQRVAYYLVIPFALYLFASYQFYRFLCQPERLASELARGLAHQQFKPYIQPIFDCGGSLVGGEILVRWHHPKLGIIGPYEFISILERGGLSHKLTESLMEKAAEQLAPIAKALPDGFHLSFNISAEQLTDRKIVHCCQRFRQMINAPHVQLILELTEREQAVEAVELMDTYQALKEENVLISVDDFGTGHSSLIYFQMFKADYLKIDKSFVDLIGENALSNHIVNNVLDLARRLNIPTVAEGVERPEQLQYLTVHGVDFFQGYLFSKPITMDDFVEDYCQPDSFASARRFPD
ncbi:EAL domain-containing protein [Vibrio fluvialis]|uniref:EAL domain-containing protein n=1 Tax=Vibrio fluvialis TaxID=676 RepID=UPI00192C50C3|nr:EAL domain-containing protein [Vibrio fluvialis]MBL4284697.1 EAL domain-containing protein [Vibrio fluvialis]MBY8089566.1 EAL domain-containing protein [Vibrio fluvialis]